MQTHRIQVLGAHEHVHEIRGELFAFPEVLEVFVTGRPDLLVVVCAGRPRPGEWLRALRAIDCRMAARDHARWPRPDQRSESLLRRIVESRPDLGAADGDRANRSIRSEQAPRRRRDAA
jgi:hypothetical protein